MALIQTMTILLPAIIISLYISTGTEFCITKLFMNYLMLAVGIRVIKTIQSNSHTTIRDTFLLYVNLTLSSQLPLPRGDPAVDDGALHHVLRAGDVGGVSRDPAAPLQDLCLSQLDQDYQEHPHLLLYHRHVYLQVRCNTPYER